MALLVSHCSNVPKHSEGPLKYVFCDGFSADTDISESEPLRELRSLFTLVQPVEPQCRSKSPAFNVLLQLKYQHQNTLEVKVLIMQQNNTSYWIINIGALLSALV